MENLLNVLALRAYAMSDTAAILSMSLISNAFDVLIDMIQVLLINDLVF